MNDYKNDFKEWFTNHPKTTLYFSDIEACLKDGFRPLDTNEVEFNYLFPLIILEFVYRLCDKHLRKLTYKNNIKVYTYFTQINHIIAFTTDKKVKFTIELKTYIKKDSSIKDYETYSRFLQLPTDEKINTSEPDIYSVYVDVYNSNVDNRIYIPDESLFCLLEAVEELYERNK